MAYSKVFGHKIFQIPCRESKVPKLAISNLFAFSKNYIFSKNVPSFRQKLNQQKIRSDQSFEQTSAIYFYACFQSVIILICFPQSVRLYYRPRANQANPGPSLQRWRVQLLLQSVKYRLVLKLLGCFKRAIFFFNFQLCLRTRKVLVHTVLFIFLYTPVKSYVVKWHQEKQACHSHDGATPLTFRLRVSKGFF